MNHLAGELAWLEANHQDMPVPALQARRGAALNEGKALLEQLAVAEHYDNDAYLEVYDLVLALDRVGY
jgi:hypothetical protein